MNQLQAKTIVFLKIKAILRNLGKQELQSFKSFLVLSTRLFMKLGAEIVPIFIFKNIFNFADIYVIQFVIEGIILYRTTFNPMFKN